MIPIGFISKGSSGPSDPNYSSVQLLLHGEGTNTGTTFTDNSPFARTLTASGNVQTSTTQFKMGASSIKFDGTGDYLLNDTASVWNLSSGVDFTLEGWVWVINVPDTTNNVSTVIGLGSGTGSGSNMIRTLTVFHTGGVDKLGYFLNGSGTGSTISDNTWYHFAIVRISNSTQIYINGTAIGSPVSDSIAGLSNLTIGTDPATRNTTNAFHFNGYLDDVRFTKGVGRYTGAFTPPTAPYPDHG